MRNKIVSRLITLLFCSVFLFSCTEPKITLTGKIISREDLPAEELRARLHVPENFKSRKPARSTLIHADGLFNLKVSKNESYILEIIGAQGTGRVFLPVEKLADTIFISYPVTEEIVFLHTNDQHFDLNYLERITDRINELRASYQDVFLFSAGDIFVRHPHRWIDNGKLMDSPLWYKERALAMINTMNNLNYDLMTLGNHEVAYIPPYTRLALENARFPLLAANLDITTDHLPLVKGYEMLKTSTNRKIAVLGLTITDAGKEGIKLLNYSETVERYKHLRDTSDLFILLSHLGLENDLTLAKQYPIIDAVIGGHSHHLLEESAIVNSVLIAQAGGNPHFVSDDYPAYLGKVIIVLENGNIVKKSGMVMIFDDIEVIDNSPETELPERGFCAHWGAMATHPENTTVAIKEAVKAGAHMIEFDVPLTNDNQLVVIHDDTVDRTTNGTGKVSELSLSEIKRLDAGSWKSSEFKGQRIPTFQEVLNEMALNIWLNIHINNLMMVNCQKNRRQ